MLQIRKHNLLLFKFIKKKKKKKKKKSEKNIKKIYIKEVGYRVFSYKLGDITRFRSFH